MDGRRCRPPPLTACCRHRASRAPRRRDAAHLERPGRWDEGAHCRGAGRDRSHRPLGADPAQVLGALADHVHAEPGYRRALEAVLRFWLVSLAWRDRETLPLAARRFADYVLKHAREVLPAELAAAPT